MHEDDDNEAMISFLRERLGLPPRSSLEDEIIEEEEEEDESEEEESEMSELQGESSGSWRDN